MEIIGLIAEYNPFHQGHAYQLKTIKKTCPDGLIVVLMVGHFSQRGEPTILDKWERTRLALAYGADLVFELPFCGATASAEVYARTSLDILNTLGIHTLSFGCHTGDPLFIENLGKKILNLKESSKMKGLKGQSLPSLLFKELDLTAKEKTFLTHGNDILALEYSQAILRKNMDIALLPLERISKDPRTGQALASATTIREAVKKGDLPLYKDSLPEKTYDLLKNISYTYEDQLKNLYHYAWHFHPNCRQMKSPVQSFIYREWIEKNIPLNALSSKTFTNAFLRREILSFVFSYPSERRKKDQALAKDYLRLLGGRKEALDFLRGKKVTSKFTQALRSPLAPLYEESLKETILRNNLLGTNTPLDYYQSPLII